MRACGTDQRGNLSGSHCPTEGNIIIQPRPLFRPAFNGGRGNNTPTPRLVLISSSPLKKSIYNLVTRLRPSTQGGANEVTFRNTGDEGGEAEEITLLKFVSPTLCEKKIVDLRSVAPCRAFQRRCLETFVPCTILEHKVAALPGYHRYFLKCQAIIYRPTQGRCRITVRAQARGVAMTGQTQPISSIHLSFYYIILFHLICLRNNFSLVKPELYFFLVGIRSSICY